MPTATEQLDALDAQLAEANQRYREARDAVRDAGQIGVEVIQPVAEYHHEVDARLRQEDTNELRRRTDDVLDRIKAEGLLLGNPTPGMLTVLDPRPLEEEAAALAAFNEVRAERDKFERASRKERDAEGRRATMDAVRAAIDGEDPDALRAALYGREGEQPSSGGDGGRPKRAVKWHVST